MTSTETQRWAARERVDDEPRQLASIALGAATGQAADQCHVVDDIAGHAAAR
jgi:hypothetical protein